jgi:uncharacterized protein (UPF0548 family)
VIRLRRPSEREIEAILAATDAPLSYPEVGATERIDSPDVRDTLAARYDVDRHEVVLGTGRELYTRASAALADWRHFGVPWLELHRTGPVAPGQVVATVARIAGSWFVNPCRVVYADFSSERDSVAYAYGTLRGHAESGEERFRVSIDPATSEVRYEISAFSRPALLLSRLGYPLARRVQKSFARSSAAALIEACDGVRNLAR